MITDPRRLLEHHPRCHLCGAVLFEVDHGDWSMWECRHPVCPSNSPLQVYRPYELKHPHMPVLFELLRIPGWMLSLFKKARPLTDDRKANPMRIVINYPRRPR